MRSNEPHAANPAIPSLFYAGCHWRGSLMRSVRHDVRTFVTCGTLLLCLVSARAAESFAITPLVTEQRDGLYQRFLVETGASTNAELRTNPLVRQLFDLMVVDPSFGFRWDEVPAPTLVGSNAMLAVQAFIATNGWNMHTGNFVLTYCLAKPKKIRGLPWECIREREFPALTHDGILYVILTGWHHDCNGIAYNPTTNSFPPAVRGFKHLGQHWYAWAQPEDPITLLQQYEGHKIGEPGAATNRGQPIRSETNRTSSAAGSRR